MTHDTRPDPVWIPCQETGCPNGIGVHYRHAENFEGRYYCPGHDRSDIQLAHEVPC